MANSSKSAVKMLYNTRCVFKVSTVLRYKKTSKHIVTILFLHKSPCFNLLFHIISSNIKALIISNNKVFYTFIIEICRLMWQPLQHSCLRSSSWTFFWPSLKALTHLWTIPSLIMFCPYTSQMLRWISTAFTSAFSTQITNYRVYFTVGGIYNERRYFKYV